MLLQYLFRRFFKVPRKINFLKSVDEDFSKVYDQIANFENYSLFIPGCTKSELIEKQDKFEIGKLDFDFLFKDYSIKSKNILSDNLIKIEQIDGPFKYFTGEWRVTNKNDLKTLIEFNAEFELPFFLNNLLPEKIIDKFCESMIDAFIEWLSKK